MIGLNSHPPVQGPARNLFHSLGLPLSEPSQNLKAAKKLGFKHRSGGALAMPQYVDIERTASADRGGRGERPVRAQFLEAPAEEIRRVDRLEIDQAEELKNEKAKKIEKVDRELMELSMDEKALLASLEKLDEKLVS
eukprot:GEMP01074406.1.p1 GENE.GEMP01074406.1~~GEMP01074406.1.p1  ORF type:complete len:137 (+),score=30.86 GEMP01074406.1:68-478(+)